MTPREPKIYVLPNLMTAGNLFCGFVAVLTMVKGIHESEPSDLASASKYIFTSIGLILGACVFDLLDGRLARMGGKESPFGREFDSLADTVSFGVAPALIVYKLVLFEFDERLGYIIAFIYLLCGTMRLARFNCMAADPANAKHKDFHGFPIPMAAGVIVSVTLFMLHLDQGEKQMGQWKYALPVIMILLSILMMSRLRYPSFKRVGMRTRGSMPLIVTIVLLLICTVFFYKYMLPLLFISYLFFPLVQRCVSKDFMKGLESELINDDHPDDELVGEGHGGKTPAKAEHEPEPKILPLKQDEG